MRPRRRGIRLPALALALAALLSPALALGWGPEGHSIVAEIAQRRLTPQAQRRVAQVLGQGHSLASIASWADDVRDRRPSTTRWHFVDIPLSDSRYVPARDCAPSDRGDCAVAELNRLRAELGCARSRRTERNALRFAVHLVGDLHQPLHTVRDEEGGNRLPVEVRITELKCRRRCAPTQWTRNFHEVWDTTLVSATVWDWGAYVERLEKGWLRANARRPELAAGTPAQWAVETHRTAQIVWNMLPASHVIDDAYYRAALPILDQQLGLAGIRLAAFLNEAYGQASCDQGR